jgi:hypothetical protein
LVVESVQIPGANFSFLQTSAPTPASYSSRPELRLDFNVALAADVAQTVIVIRDGHETSLASAQAMVKGNRLIVPDSSHLSGSLVMLCLPKGLKASSGAELAADWYLLLRNTNEISPEQLLTRTTGARGLTPTLVVPVTRHAARETVYVNVDAAALRSEPSGSGKEIVSLARTANAVVLDRPMEGYVKVRVYVPIPTNSEGTLAYEFAVTEDIYSSQYVSYIDGYLRSSDVLPVPPPLNDGYSEVCEETIFETSEPAVKLVLSPAGSAVMRLGEAPERLGREQVQALEAQAIMDRWPALIGTDAMSAQDVTLPQAHEPYASLEADEATEYARFYSEYLRLLDSYWRDLLLDGNYAILRSALYREGFTKPAVLQRAWVDWSLEQKLNSPDSFARHICSYLNMTEDETTVAVQRFVSTATSSDDGFRCAIDGLLGSGREVWTTLGWLSSVGFPGRPPAVSVTIDSSVSRDQWRATDGCYTFVLAWPDDLPQPIVGEQYNLQVEWIPELSPDGIAVKAYRVL